MLIVLLFWFMGVVLETYRVVLINWNKIPDHAQQYWVQVEHKEYNQTEATLVNFKIYQNIPVCCVHCVDMDMKPLWGLNQVRGPQVYNHFQTPKHHISIIYRVCKKWEAKRDNKWNIYRKKSQKKLSWCSWIGWTSSFIEPQTSSCPCPLGAPWHLTKKLKGLRYQSL